MEIIIFIKKNFTMIFLIIAILYLLYKDRYNSLEKMSNTNEIEEKINKIYQADIQSIRNLSEVASTLQKEGLTIPGNLKVNGTFNYLPKGTIVAFTGIFAPDGWALCNGQNGTPDLRGRFIYGYGARQGIDIGKTGGEENHKLNINEMPSHNHSISSSGEHNHDTIDGNVWQNRRYGYGDGAFSGGGGAPFGTARNNNQIFKTTKNGNHTHTINNKGGNDSHNNMPPYYVLSYIMKL